MTIPFEFSQRPIAIGHRTENWGIRKSGLTFTCVRDDTRYETGDAQAAVAFFLAGREAVEVTEAAREFVATVDANLGNWPPETRA